MNYYSPEIHDMDIMRREGKKVFSPKTILIKGVPIILQETLKFRCLV